MAKTTTEHSPAFDKYKRRYARRGCTMQQLHRLTELEVLTPDEFEEITGIPFEE